MKTSARAVVIGGGVVGASTLYHLARIGWTDVLLLEKSELTSGSTWHAAGGMHTFNGEANISRLQKYTIDLYREIEALSGQSCGLHPNGGLMLAATPGELDSLRLICSRARYLGMETEMISLEEARNFNPLIDASQFIGALWRADGGHCDPSGTTHAYVKAARQLGASVERFTRVLSLGQRRDGTWDVVTDKGTVHAEHVVNCAGLWAREIGHMVGIELPVLAMEHHYLLTEDLPELEGREKEIVNTTDYAGEIYLRQHGRVQSGRGHRARAVALDGGERSGPGHHFHGRRAVRRVRDAEIYLPQGPRELLASLSARLPERGAARSPSGAPLTDLRPAAGGRRGHGRELRARECPVVRAGRRRSDGDPDLSALRSLPGRAGRVSGGTQDGRPLRDHQLWEVRGRRARGARVARPGLCVPHTRTRALRARAHAESRRPDHGGPVDCVSRRRPLPHRGVGLCRGVPAALVLACCATGV